MRKDSFVMYTEYKQYFNMLSLEEQGKLIQSLFNFVNDEEQSNNESMRSDTKMAYAFITNQIKRDQEKYAEKCEKNKTNGSLGGRPKIEKQTDIEETKRFSKKANGYSDNPNDNDNDNDNKKKQEKKKTPTKKDATVKNTILADGELDILIDKSFTDPDVRVKFRDYANMRAGMGKNKAIRTRATFDGCISKIRKFAKTKQQAIDILDESITNNWTGLFELKPQPQSVEEVPFAN